MTYGSALLALADPTRRQVFEHLRGGPRAVGEIAAEMPVSRPAVSQHLKVLKDAGLVLDQAEGTRRVYYIDPNGLAALRSWLDQFWDTALEAFKAEVEKPAGQTSLSATPAKGVPDELIPTSIPAAPRERRPRTQAGPRQRRRRPRI
jgi:DNA-binding transcriptional ArsR family regulator